MNKLLAEYYGELIPKERAPEEDSGLFTPKTTPAKYHGHFPTPEAAAERLIGSASLYRPEDEPALSVLEPSAGAGNLARRAAEQGAVVDCIEIQPHLAASLRQSALYRRVTEADFLTLTPDRSALYDRVIMNPPFDRERDIDHVMHALEFLKPGGLLTTIMSAGTEFRETKKSRAFRDRMASLNARWRDLPARSFSDVGTNINTVIVTVRKDGTRLQHLYF